MACHPRNGAYRDRAELSGRRSGINQIRAVALAKAARGEHAKRLARKGAGGAAGSSGSGSGPSRSPRPRACARGDEARADAGPHTISY